ncbi:ribonuclease P protein subunit p25-like protein [Scyliorhinus canicula]|uniref:ribonuclease P protein subunit p25-like protein n=1 Tax=Scyliorhinus canicula TaxID=7830 RepID=UPI0018F55353|nr:ribonuclease P protein subunit p25-like protein [Scyliorhinus canicula]
MQGSAQGGEMENYRKIGRTEEESPLPFADLPLDIVEMKVKEGSKIRNLMGFAMGRMALEGTRQIVFSGSGRAVTKTITCVEIMKRRIGGLHQVTKLRYKSLQETWEHRGGPEGTPNLTLLKSVPSICILLSKEPLDAGEAGYQPPDTGGGLWLEGEVETLREEEGEDPSPSPRGVKRSLCCEDTQMVKKISREDRQLETAPLPNYNYIVNYQQ